MKNKNKKVKTIVFSVAILILLVLCIFLIVNIFSSHDTYPSNKSQYVILGSGEHKTFTTRSGTENFRIPIAFAPNNTEAWGITNEGCKYNIQAVNQAGYCINKGWDNVEYDLSTGMSITTFDIVENGIGYALIKINVPKNIQPCTQRFTVEIKCNSYPLENIKDYFDLNVIERNSF